MNDSTAPEPQAVQAMAESILAAVDARPDRIGVTFGYLVDAVSGFSAAEGEPQGEIALDRNGHLLVLWAGLSMTAMQAIERLTSEPSSPLTYQSTTEFDYALGALLGGGNLHVLKLPVIKNVSSLRPAKKSKKFWAPVLVGRRAKIAAHLAAKAKAGHRRATPQGKTQ